MRVSILARRLDAGGAETQVVTLARALAQAGHEVSILVFYGGGELETAAREAGIAIVPLGKAGRWDVVRFFLGLVRAVRRERPEVLHSVLPAANLVALGLRPLFPRLPVVWGIRSTVADFAGYDALRRLSFFLEARLGRFASGVIVNSERGLEVAAARGVPRNKLVVVPNGIDVTRFRPDTAAGRELREEWGVAGDRRLIGMVARLDPIKDHMTFLEAAAGLALERDDVCFVCVGDGAPDYRRQLREAAAARGLGKRLIWAGPGRDMRAVYNALDLATLCSQSEGFPNALAEAMACGVPCVTTDVGDAAAIVADTGAVVPVGDAHALAEGWRGLLERKDREPGLAALARERVVSRFGCEALVRRTEDAFAEFR